ncbi:hypothetical protein [Clostridium botulinum]|uniref:CBM6 domain-containing protein n=1 Tax=Clostridium botulinum TaxID=1491 RepID=A0A9Q1UWW5_CLOBO|nr:hypothetical protein [Clostridium botulinum]AEB77570.1 hypothetical protein CbC4_6045 [Clostridium botulinum BKT015925]KEH95965.1 hypothetical protein Y848_p0141 [Clostridium botulinum C/D str. Sp77]KLU74561.1 hypothetical protein CBC3_13580 [Clostridium botulinum V891]KOA78054.1 hypothetical protein ADU77_06715 [Clostridium botulinum]KOA83016.1 hypothetical protein ADU80_12955 [Clostridium botulinum]
MNIQAYKVILGQSIDKTIRNPEDEITLSLSLQPDATRIIYGPKYDSFTITSTGGLPAFNQIIEAENATLLGSAQVVSGGLVSGVAYGLGKISFSINAPATGVYTLSMKYVSPESGRTVRIFINQGYYGIYTFEVTTTINPVKNKDVEITLQNGTNIIEIS